MSVVGQRLCADAERGDALVRCFCGNLRPASREHSEVSEAALAGGDHRHHDAAWSGPAEEQPGLAPCPRPPLGWRCTRTVGHEGPCAAMRDWLSALGTFGVRVSCPAHPDASTSRHGEWARCDVCAGHVAVCRTMFGRKECVLARGHATQHCSPSGSSW